MSEKAQRLSEALVKHGHFQTFPVGIKLARDDERISQRVKYPLRDIGNRLCLCQGMTVARTYGWTIALGKEDHACPVASVFLGHVEPDIFLSGAIAKTYQDSDECARIMESSFPRWPVSSVREVWLSPLDHCQFEPDVALAYGNPAQILLLIQAANFGRGSGVKSWSCGRGGCAAWVAGVIQSDECAYIVPGSGERVFAGTQDHEMSFAIPYSRFENVAAGLEFVRKKGAYRYPVQNLAILSPPKIPREYLALDPDFPAGSADKSSR